MPPKECEVCGGHVRPLGGQSSFGSCEKCGIVYVLKDGGKEESVTETPEGLKVSAESERGGTASPGGTPAADVMTLAQPSGSYWRCPDCSTEIRSDNDSDLRFSKREHIREYHPNRPTD